MQRQRSEFLQDVMCHPTCTFDAMLTAFLVRCLLEDERKTPPADLLEQFIEAVIPFCNNLSDSDLMRAFLSED